MRERERERETEWVSVSKWVKKEREERRKNEKEENFEINICKIKKFAYKDWSITQISEKIAKKY